MFWRPTFVHSLRMPLHKPVNAEVSGESASVLSQPDELETSRSQIIKILDDSLANLEEGKQEEAEVGVRWELASCWVQYLQKQESEKNPKESENPKNSELYVKGLGKEFKSLKKRDKKPNSVDSSEGLQEKESQVSGLESDEGLSKDLEASELGKILSKEAFLRLKETGTGLHLKVLRILLLIERSLMWWNYLLMLLSLFLSQTVDELLTMVQSYYDDIALPKLVLQIFKHNMISKSFFPFFA